MLSGCHIMSVRCNWWKYNMTHCINLKQVHCKGNNLLIGKKSIEETWTKA